MGRLRKLYEKAKSHPNNLSFRELCSLAEKVGFIRRKQRSGTSHRVYTHPELTTEEPLTFQSNRGKAKAYQVKQLLDIIDDHDLLREE